MRFILGLMIAVAAAIGARAETVFLKEMPSSKISSDDAAASTKPVYQCALVHRGPNVNPVKVPGSQVQWAAEVGKGEQDVASLLKDGKAAVRCKSMRLDAATGRMKAAN